jgi:hypothetical protein
MIRSAYIRIYVPSSRVGPLPPFKGGPVGDGAIMQDSTYIWDEPLTNDGFYTEWNSTQYVCPRNIRVRMIEGILAFARTYPMMPTVTESRRNEYQSELNRLRRETTHSKSHILSSAWHVPLRWFTAFRSVERDLYDDGNGPSIRYRATVGDSIDRVKWAGTVLENAGFGDQVVERVHDLERWLAGFTADALVELDYGTVSASFSEGDLVFDESADDIRTSLLALEADDFPASQEAYERVARRWANPQSYTYSN